MVWSRSLTNYLSTILGQDGVTLSDVIYENNDPDYEDKDEDKDKDKDKDEEDFEEESEEREEGDKRKRRKNNCERVKKIKTQRI